MKEDLFNPDMLEKLKVNIERGLSSTTVAQRLIQYGKNKSEYCKNGDILFDDEKPNREKWIEKNGIAYDVNNIIDILMTL